MGGGSSSSAQDGNCFARDHQLFLGWDHHGDPIPIAGNATVAARAVDRVALRIELKTEETKLLNHRSPNRRSVLANSAGENQRSDSAERHKQYRDRLRQAIAENLNRKSRAFISSRRRFDQLTHVVA